MNAIKKIEITKQVYLANTIVTIDFYDNKLPQWLEKELAKHDVVTQPGCGLSTRYIKLIVECDTTNKYNPSADQIAKNVRLLNDILDMTKAKVKMPAKKTIFSMAWAMAKAAAKKFGGKSKAFFAEALRLTYKNYSTFPI